ncbi:hypothetical protein EDB80DRAFT_756458 [Ilyonectria destructans]|nr:hypothetical protein EDB80DRAFT_756458 [Ilyonectria destructans]
MRLFLFHFTAFVWAVAAAPSGTCSDPLLTVDLGYEIHRAISFNVRLLGHDPIRKHWPNGTFARMLCDGERENQGGAFGFLSGPNVRNNSTANVGLLDQHMALEWGGFDKSVKIMTAYNHNETELFTSEDNVNNTVFVNNLRTTFPGAQEAVIEYIPNDLYPPIFNGSQSYNDFVPTSVALILQRYLASFALTGNPNMQAVLEMPVYDPQGLLLEFNSTYGLDIIPDPSINRRCEWWQKALYF